MDRFPRGVSMWSSELICPSVSVCLSTPKDKPNTTHQNGTKPKKQSKPSQTETKPNQTNQSTQMVSRKPKPPKKRKETKIHGRYRTPCHSSITFPKELNLSFIRCSWSPRDLKDIPGVFWRWTTGVKKQRGKTRYCICSLNYLSITSTTSSSSSSSSSSSQDDSWNQTENMHRNIRTYINMWKRISAKQIEAIFRNINSA